VDARGVTREINRLVWRPLREEGFSVFTGRSGWRYIDGDIDVINFQSFNASLADAIGCTTYSFAVNLGSWLAESLASEGLQRKLQQDLDGRLRPEEYQCPHRLELEKSLEQPWFKPFSHDTRNWPQSLRCHREGLEKVFRHDQHDRADIWFVLEDGSNVGVCLEDALQAIRADGLPWFDETHRERRAPPRPPSAQTQALLQALRRPPR
jgi:Domain of unknown function (DUF4304)